MTLAEDSKIRPIDFFSSLEISSWCRDYIRYNKYPANIIERFAIGIYQIHQGMEWADAGNKAESFMSATLHFLMVGEMLKAGCYMPETIETKPLNYQRLVYLISKIQQQIFYYHKSTVKSVDGKVYQRSSRFKLRLTEQLLQELVNNLVACVPSYARQQGLFDASKIMSGIL